MDFKNNIAQDVSKITGIAADKITPLLEIPPDPKLGDYALPCFIIAKEQKKNPMQIAQELKEKLAEYNQIYEKIESKGPYLNFFLNKHMYIRGVLETIHSQQECYGSLSMKDAPVVLIESPGPNTNKPLHLGHLRNMLLGSSIYNILKFSGKDAHIVNVVNDRGVHICKSMLAYKMFGNGQTPESTGIKGDHYVGDFYVKYSKAAESNAELENEVQEMLVKWEENDPEIRALWSMMNEWTLTGFAQTYKRLNFNIEKEYYESSTYLHGKEIILDGLKKGIFEKDETGAIIFNLESKGLGKKILLRGNGTSVYITQDIYMASKRYDDFKFNEMVYIVGNEQEYHFKVLFEIFKALNWPFADKCYHFSYGMIELPEGKMKSREGNVVDTDNLLDDIEKLAEDEVRKRYADLPEHEIHHRSRRIAQAAVRFFFLKFDPLKNFVFNPKESLSFEGETGPYVEYSYARINSIFRKFEAKEGMKIAEFIKNADISLLKESNEFEISKKLEAFPTVIRAAAKDFKPSAIARYLLDLCQMFNEFYHANPILQADAEIKKARLYLIYNVQTVIKIGLNLLGIEEIEEM